MITRLLSITLGALALAAAGDRSGIERSDRDGQRAGRGARRAVEGSDRSGEALIYQ